MNLRDKIYEIMSSGNMCQAAVARAAGYKPKKFNDMLRGRALITGDDITPLCSALNVTPNELFDGVDREVG